MEFIGQGAQALGEHGNLGHQNGEFTGFGFEELAFSANDVAQIPVFEILIHGFADIVFAHVELNAAGVINRDAIGFHRRRAILNRGKAGLAHHALKHHAARHHNWNARAIAARHLLRVIRHMQVKGFVLRLEAIREGDALATDGG